MMNPKLYYLNHSGFLLELEKALLVFDFYTDPAGVLASYNLSNKPAVFFVSHDHLDHWNPDILKFKNKAPSFYVLDSSCDSEPVREAAAEKNRKVILVNPRDVLQKELSALPSLLRIYTFDSTDEGVVFLVVTDEGSFIHMGDLNDWDWQDEDSIRMEVAYKEALGHMADAWSQVTKDENLPAKAGQLILGCVPVDKRLQQMALKGALTFLEYLQPRYIAPMHLQGGEKLPHELAAALSQQGHGNLTKVLDLTVPGQMTSLA